MAAICKTTIAHRIFTDEEELEHVAGSTFTADHLGEDSSGNPLETPLVWPPVDVAADSAWHALSLLITGVCIVEATDLAGGNLYVKFAAGDTTGVQLLPDAAGVCWFIGSFEGFAPYFKNTGTAVVKVTIRGASKV